MLKLKTLKLFLQIGKIMKILIMKKIVKKTYNLIF